MGRFEEKNGSGAGQAATVVQVLFGLGLEKMEAVVIPVLATEFM